MQGTMGRGLTAGLALLLIASLAGAVELIPRWEFNMEASHSWGDRYAGVTHDGTNFWGAQHGDRGHAAMFWRFDEAGNPLGSSPQNPVTEYGYNDLGWNGTYIWGSECGLLHAHWTCGGYAGWINGPPGFTPSNPIRSIAWRNADCYVGGGNTYVYKGTWNGAWNSTPTWAPISPAPITDLSGLAVDEGNDCLWGTTLGGDHVTRMDMGGQLLDEVALPDPPGTAQGCCVAETVQWGKVLAVLFSDVPDRAEDVLVLYEISETATSKSSWSAVKALY